MYCLAVYQIQMLLFVMTLEQFCRYAKVIKSKIYDVYYIGSFILEINKRKLGKNH